MGSTPPFTPYNSVTGNRFRRNAYVGLPPGPLPPVRHDTLSAGLIMIGITFCILCFTLPSLPLGEPCAVTTPFGVCSRHGLPIGG